MHYAGQASTKIGSTVQNVEVGSIFDTSRSSILFMIVCLVRRLTNFHELARMYRSRTLETLMLGISAYHALLREVA